jgi:hypothetical protein
MTVQPRRTGFKPVLQRTKNRKKKKMFLAQLSHPQKVAFLQLAHEIVLVDDGKIDEFEGNMLSLMAKEAEIPLDEIQEKGFDFDESASKFNDILSKNICLLELIGIAYSNREFHENQKDFVGKLAKIFGSDETHVSDLHNWVVAMLNLYDKVQELIQKG